MKVNVTVTIYAYKGQHFSRRSTLKTTVFPA